MDYSKFKGFSKSIHYSEVSKMFSGKIITLQHEEDMIVCLKANYLLKYGILSHLLD